MTLRHLIFALVVASSAVGASAAQSPIVGVASVIDGDTLEIHGQRIRLHGIDAPESRQFCEKNGKKYRCGQQAALALADKVGRATIRCEQRDIDRYKRIVAVCRLGSEDQIGSEDKIGSETQSGSEVPFGSETPFELEAPPGPEAPLESEAPPESGD